MAHWRRRSVLSTGVALATGATLASVGTAGADATTANVEAATAGEERGWSSARGNAGNTGFVPAEGSFPEPEGIAWTYDRTGDFAAVDGAVYLRTGSEVHAVDDADGSVRWTVDGIDAAGTPAVAGDTVYVGGGQLTALEGANGDTRWTTPLEGTATSPTVVDGVVYVVADGELLAVDAADGSTAWRRERVALERSAANVDVDDADVGFAALPVAVANGAVYAAVGEGTGYDGTAGFAALEATTGETWWTYWEPWRWDPHGYVMAVRDRVYTGSISDGETHPVLDAETGAEIERLTVRFPPAMTDETRVATDRHGISSADHGEPERWRERGGTDAWRRPVIVGETVVVPYYPGDETVNALYGFDLEDGTERWTFTHADVDVADLSERYAASEETIYVSASDEEGSERLMAIRAGDGAANDGDESEEGADGDESRADDPGDDPDDGAEERSSGDAGNESDAEADDTGDSGDEPEESDTGSDEVDSEPDETAAETDDENASGDAGDGDLEDGSESDGIDSSDDASSDGAADETTVESDAEGSNEGEPDDGDNPGTDGTVDGADDGYAGEEARDDANTTDDGASGTDGGSDGSTADGSSDDPRGVDENSSATGQGGEDAETAAADADGMPGFTAGVGVVGGALGLEWLRRYASVDEDAAE